MREMKKVSLPKALVIVGQTSSGKTALGIKLAKKFNGEIISADSRQVYIGLDIGTGKVTKKEMRGVPHHLLDVATPKRVYTAQNYVTDGRKAIAGIVRRKKLPIIVGGTGFYIDSLLGIISLPDVPSNKALRKLLSKMSASKLYTLLNKKDPRRAKDIDRHNPVRLIRALEIAEAIGKSPKSKSSTLYDTCWLGIALPFDKLEKKIEKRFRERMKQGMLKEAKRLHVSGVSWKRMEELGLEYRYMARLLQKKITRKEFDEQLLSEIKKYAKRQMKYWKRNKEIRWFEPEDKRVEEVAKNFLIN